MNTGHRRLSRFLVVILCLGASVLSARNASAQTETFEPYALRADQTEVRVWTSGDHTFARVNLTFNDGGYRVTNIGPVTRQGNNLSVDYTVDHWTGGTTQAVVFKEYFFDLGALPAEGGTFTFTVRSRGAAVRSVTFDPRRIVEHWEETSLPRGSGFAVWTAGGVTFTSVGLSFPDEGYRVVEWKEPVLSGHDFVTRVRLERWTGRASALVHSGERRVFSLGTLPPNETFTVSVEFSDGVRQTSFPFTPAGTARPADMNSADDPAFFVRQQYVDFLGREPDAEGLTFWYDDIVTNCSFFPSPCADVKRVNVSAAFFVSIEFQRTGFLVHRLYRASYGRMPRRDELLADTRQIARGVVVGKAGWETLLASNTDAFLDEWVNRSQFKADFGQLDDGQFVERLYRNAGLAPLPGAASSLASDLASGRITRAGALRAVAEEAEFSRREFGPAFVLMQYFGYLQRNPNEGRDANWDGYDYWLAKLNEFGGDYVAAEMVKAFITSDEYRLRFVSR
jgi:hypothetical protein